MANICDYSELDMRPASFRGVTFNVSQDSTSTGRRIVTHEFPMRDDPYHEDLGRKFATFKVTAYVYGSDCENQKDAVLNACSAFGPALLVLPQSAPVMAVCASVSASRTLDKLGWFTLDMEFREVSDLVGGLLSGTFFGGVIGSLFSSLVSTAAGLFQRDFKTSLQTINVVNDAVTRVEDIAATLIYWSEGSPISDQTKAQSCLRDATSILTNATYYASPDPSTGAGIAGSVALSSGNGSGLQLTGTGRPTAIEAIAACVENLFNALDTDQALHCFHDLKDFVSSAPPVDTIKAPSDQVNNDNEDRLVGSFRRMCAVKWAEAVAYKQYDTRAEAIQARADIAESFYDLILAADYDADTVAQLTTARDQAVQALNATITSLASTLTISTTTAMSALYWSYRVQGDLDQAEGIAMKNGAVDWMNIGGEFTVEVR